MRKQVILSKRLQAVADLLGTVDTAVDVGCDHGFVSIYLIQRGRARSVIAMDVNEGPLRYAARHVAEAGLESYIQLRSSDGLHGLSAGEADGMIIAGMGGRLIRRILQENWEKVCAMRSFVLQPQSEIDEVRAFLKMKGCVTKREDMVCEDGKYYMMMRVIPGGQESGVGTQSIPEDVIPHATQLQYGAFLIATHHPVLEQYLRYRRGMYEGILEQYPAGGDRVRRDELEREIAGMDAIMEYWNNGERL